LKFAKIANSVKKLKLISHIKQSVRKWTCGVSKQAGEEGISKRKNLGEWG